MDLDLLDLSGPSVLVSEIRADDYRLSLHPLMVFDALPAQRYSIQSCFPFSRPAAPFLFDTVSLPLEGAGEVSWIMAAVVYDGLLSWEHRETHRAGVV